jgi:transcriptional regulator with XRE-family HTH domain
MSAQKTVAEDPNHEQAQRLGAALRAHRKALGVSMTVAAETAGISRVTWHRLEKGEASVAWGSLLAAAGVLGMELHLGIRNALDGSGMSQDLPEEVLPLRIRLQDYPGLRRLAWQVSEAVDILSPREAFGLYTRNARHLHLEELSPAEQSLLRALREVFGETAASV